MAYTIIRSNGSQLTTIQDGTINTTSTTLGLPGRNYAGYGQTLNTNFVRLIENFASGNVPANPIRGQLWFDTSATAPGVLKVCPSDGQTDGTQWLTLASTASGANLLTAGNLNIANNINCGNLYSNNEITSDSITVNFANVSESLVATYANITTGDIPTVNTRNINTGSNTTSGVMTGEWTLFGNTALEGHALMVNGNISFAGGNTSVYGIRCENYMKADGTPWTPEGTYNDADVSLYLSSETGGFNGPIFPSSVTTSAIRGGGKIYGAWTLASGATFNATYADLAERYEADAVLEVGTVVQIGGDKEVTSVKDDASEEVFGVVSKSYAYLLNSEAGTDETHPAIAIAGRVPVKVTGQVRKGQRLVSAGNGVARAANAGEATSFNVIGRALANKTDDGLGTVEAIVIIR